MLHNENSVLLSEYCFNVCEALNIAIQGRSVDDLNEPVRTALDDLGRWVDRPLPGLPSTKTELI